MDDLASQAVPLGGPAKADFPLPPANLVDQLDNQPSAGATAAAGGRDPEVATLDFIGDELPYRDFPLRYRFQLAGAVVETVRVRQLTTAEVGRISGDWARSGRAPDYFDLYAVMTGLPAPVLRALPSTDGDVIVGTAFDFLPPSFRPEAA